MTIHTKPEDAKAAASAGEARTYDVSPIYCNKFGHYVYEVSDIQRTLKFWTEVMN